MFGINHTEVIIVLVIVLIIFGPTKLPQLARSIGRSVRELKDGLNEVTNDIKKYAKDEWRNKAGLNDREPAATSEAQPVEHSEPHTAKNA